MASEWEASARARKVARLVQAISSYAGVFGEPIDVAKIAAWSHSDWQNWAAAAAVRVPSETTKVAVIEAFRARARRSA